MTWRTFSIRRPAVSGQSRSNAASSIASSSSTRASPPPDFTVSVDAPSRRRIRTSVPSGSIAT